MKKSALTWKKSLTRFLLSRRLNFTSMNEEKSIGINRMVGAAALAAFIIVIVSVGFSAVAGFDGVVAEWFYAVRSDSLTSFFIFITDLGDKKLIFPLAAVFCIFLISVKKIRQTVFVASLFTVGSIAVAALKEFIIAARPESPLIEADG